MLSRTADHLFWMSVDQRDRFHQRFPFLKDRPSTVLSSVFSKEFFGKIDQLSILRGGPVRKGWIVLGSKSWIKGFSDAELWCQENGKDFEI